MRHDPPRRYDRITRPVLDRLSEIAAEDLIERFDRRPRWDAYRERVLCVALCQGAALHYVDGRNGVKDLDVWTFFAEADAGPFPPRWLLSRQFDLDPFAGHHVDLLGRSLREPVGTDPQRAIRRYLTRGTAPTPRALAQKAVVLIDPQPLRGQVAWPR